MWNRIQGEVLKPHIQRVTFSGVPGTVPNTGQLPTLASPFLLVLNDFTDTIITKLRFQFDMVLPDSWFPKHFRITLLNLKPWMNTNMVEQGIPFSLGAYRNLALDPGNASCNFFWRKYHQGLDQTPPLLVSAR